MSSVRLALRLVALITCCGCSGIEIATGPFFEWSGRPEARGSEQFPLKFIDRRPDWERSYRVPATDSCEYAWGVGFIPMENLVPHIPQAMEASVRDALETTDSGYTFGDLTLLSFRVLVDRRDILRDWFDEDVRQARLRDEEEIPLPAMFPSLKFEGTRRLLVGPPAELQQEDSQIEPGVSCRIQAVIGLHRADGTREEFQVTGLGSVVERSRSDYSHFVWDAAAAPVNSACVNRAVKQAIAEFEFRATRVLRSGQPAGFP